MVGWLCDGYWEIVLKDVMKKRAFTDGLPLLRSADFHDVGFNTGRHQINIEDQE
jgi:hypothetical protein